MLLTFENGVFTFQCDYAEKDIPWRAGFYFDKTTRAWVSTAPRKAAGLREYADATALKEINRVLLTVTPWPRRLSWPKALSPKSYQLADARFALERNRSYLALDPGSGKTIIAALIARAIAPTPLIYICPPMLMQTVAFEFEKWGAPRPTIVPDSKLARPENLAMLRLAGANGAALIVDEAHRFKNPKAGRTVALFSLTPHFERITFMSGTPMPNRPIELFPVLNACAPESIGFMGYFDYARRYCAAHRTRFGWDYSGASNVKELGEKVRAVFMRRRRKSEILPDLPPKTHELVLIGENLPPRVAALDRQILKAFSPEDLMNNEGAHVATYRRELGLIKAPLAGKFVADILSSTDEAVLVFAHHKATVAALAHALAKYKPLVITGDVPTQKRNALVLAFQDCNGPRVLIGNIDACGLGYTLTKATRVIFAEFSYVPAANEQASDRAHRIGQRENVLVQYLVFKNSIDRSVLETILRKDKALKHI